jgi:hypothetical protein
MSRAVAPDPVLPVVSVLFPGGLPLEPAADALEGLFGPAMQASEPFPFELTDYYSGEMGEGLQRVWISYRRLQGAEELPGWKLDCARLEMELSGGGPRSYNLDPGYLDHGKLVLASFKGAPDKIYMGRGVYAHTCLRYRFGSFRAPDHSFPDFTGGTYDDFMMELRRGYKEMLRELRSQADR